MHTLGRTVRRLRDASDFTQEELASAVGITASYLSHIESGRREPSLRVVRELARAFRVWPGLLLTAFIQTEMPRGLRPVFDAFVDELLDATDRAQLELPMPMDGERSLEEVPISDRATDSTTAKSAPP